MKKIDSKAICSCGNSNKDMLYNYRTVFMPGTCCSKFTCSTDHGRNGKEILSMYQSMYFVLFPCGGYYLFEGSFKQFMKELLSLESLGG